MENAYRDARWKLPDDYLTYQAFEDAIRHLDMTSSPGIPYMKEATTNGQWLGWNGIEANPIQLRRLWYDTQCVLDGTWGDNLIRVFVKQEPTKITKVLENRWRLIMASALPVQMAWQMLFRYHNDREIAQSYFIPSQQGIKLIGGGWKRYRAQWKCLGLENGLDKSAWDWTMPYWCIKLDLEFRRRMGTGSQLGQWFEKATMLYDRMFKDPILVTSSGHMFRQVVPGIMKSGCYNTISTNSHGQCMIHCAVCYDDGISVHPMCKACGDDTLQHSKHCSNINAYRKYGIIVKSASESMEFVGHEFTSGGPHPLYMAKHLKKIQYVPEKDMAQYLDAMARMYVHTRYFDLWKGVACASGYDLPLSKEAYKFWYDYAD